MLVDGHRILSVDQEAGKAGEPGTRVMGEEPRRGDEPVTCVRAVWLTPGRLFCLGRS
jgi:hypothetical protein